jgi:hypothetical protein
VSPDSESTTSEDIPAHLREFSTVFSKESFDILPDPKLWDHAIELVPGESLSGCKVYPLSPSEQKELDVFLRENLETGLSPTHIANPPKVPKGFNNQYVIYGSHRHT